MDTQFKIDEPRKGECEAFRVVLLDGERSNVHKSGEIKDVNIVRLGNPVNRKEPDGLKASRNAFGRESAPKGMEVSPYVRDSKVQVHNAVASKSAESDGRKEGGKAAFKPQSPPGGGVRVIDLNPRRKVSGTPSGEGSASEKEAKEENEGGSAAFGRRSGKKQKKLDSRTEENKNLQKDLNSSIAEGSFTTASSSIIGSYSTPFALALGASSSEIGLLSSVQNLAGILSQIPGALLTRRMTRKKIWVMCTILSRLLLLPIIFIGLFVAPSTEIWIVIALLGLVSFFSTMRGPAWSSMMGDIVPADCRGSYFGKRNMVINFAGMVTTLAAGVAVFYWGFPIIFALAIILTTISIVFFVHMREPDMKRDNSYHYRTHFRPGDLVLQIKTNRSFALFTVYMTVVNFGVNVAAPFATVYMLKNLDIGYGWFAVVVTVGTLVYLLSTRYWGRKCDKYGNRKILLTTGILMCFVPVGYMLSTNAWDILIVKIYDGFVWGGFDLVIFNYLLGVTPSDKRPGFVANHNFMTGIGTVLGALVGAVLVVQLQASSFSIFFGLQLVFAISVILRLSSLVFLPKIAEIEAKECAPLRYVFLQTVAIGPARGIEHAMNNAFHYPYGVKIKCALRLDNSRKIKISKKCFALQESGNQKAHDSKVFSHIGVSPIKVPSQAIKASGQKMEGGRSAFSQGFKKDGVFEMSLTDKLKSRQSSSGSGEEYIELGLERQSPKAARIVVHNLQRFSETDRVVKSIRAKNVVFVGLKTMKQSSMDELKQSVAKINRACVESGSSMSLVEEEWLIVTPQTAAIV